ncbi:hypothetical protein [Acaryochloris sp. IP29b_bin.137]|uniref:hypothetical protein n=1 Tax=Acaryochloris sp. IP29b_bin.137 TaxID=2969217 RepID=UPI00260C96DF|nr:hypothetical protein [Acaryochloris sp. IP29b_bin.137]
MSGDSDSNLKIATQSFLESTTPIQQSLLGSYVLIYMQVLVGILRRQPRQLSETIAGFQQTPLYSQWCEVIEQDSDLSQRWTAILDHSDLRTNQACDEYALKCHQFYEALINVLYQTQEGIELPPAQLQLNQQNLLCSYILNYIQVLICGLSTHPSELDKAIAAFKNIPLYTQCSETLEQSAERWQRWDSTLASEIFTTEAECEAYSLACHQLYYELVDDPISSPVMAPLSPDLRLTYQHWICSYVLTHIQVLISVYHHKPKRLSEAISTFKTTPLYTKCCEVLETSPAAWQRWNSTLTPTTLTTEAECNAYALACHHLYAEIMG